MKVKVLKPYGLCPGVEYVLKILDEIISKHGGEKIYCVGDLVHNQEVINFVNSKGVIVLSGNKAKLIDEIESGVVVFPAHGTDDDTIKKASEKGLIVYNAVCPFVKKEMEDISKYIDQGYEVIFIGVQGHDEANAVMSLSNTKIYLITKKEDLEKLENLSEKIVVVNQTTLSVENLKQIHSFIAKKFPNAKFENEVCNSSRIRQSVLNNEKEDFDLVLVIGDKNSNNTQTLFKIAKAKYKNVENITSSDKIDKAKLESVNSVLVVSGASVMKKRVDEIVEIIKKI